MAKQIKTRKIETVRDARLEKLQADAVAEARDVALYNKHLIPAGLDPRIGAIQRAQGVAFYAYVEGRYYEASPERLTEMLVEGRRGCKNCAGSGFIGNTATRCGACATRRAAGGKFLSAKGGR